jgi:hypothetical protein
VPLRALPSRTLLSVPLGVTLLALNKRSWVRSSRRASGTPSLSNAISPAGHRDGRLSGDPSPESTTLNLEWRSPTGEKH